jgi:hypothetical protein
MIAANKVLLLFEQGGTKKVVLVPTIYELGEEGIAG